jgi:tetratricopeptide (TPR) repeat protein
VGNEAGVCEELRGIWLYSSSEIYNSQIVIVDYGSFMFNKIKPYDQISGYLTFSVPKDADDLELRFLEEYGGARKYITKSYNKSITENTFETTEKFRLEGDNYFSQKNYELAVKKYVMCITYDPTRKKEFNRKISDCYTLIAEDFYTEYKSSRFQGSLDKYLENMKLALEYDNTNYEAKKELATYYEESGDSKLKEGKNNDAINEYNNSLKYYESITVRGKLKNVQYTEQKKKDSQRERISDLELYRQLIYPNTGIIFTAGLGINTNTKVKTDGYFWNVQLGVPVKLATLKPPGPAITFFLNFDAAYQGMIGSAKDVGKYFKVDSVVSLNNGPLVGEFYFNGGFGVGLLNKSVTPMFTVYYGLYGQHHGFELSNTLSSQSISLKNKEISKVNIGSGFKIELSIMIGKNPGFFVAYCFRDYNLKSDLDFLDNRYSGHFINLGIINF